MQLEVWNKNSLSINNGRSVIIRDLFHYEEHTLNHEMLHNFKQASYKCSEDWLFALSASNHSVGAKTDQIVIFQSFSQIKLYSFPSENKTLLFFLPFSILC